MGHPRRNSRIYPRCPWQFDKNLETSHSLGDEARFPCIGSRPIPCSPSNMINGLTSFRQLQRFPDNTITSLEEHKFQHSNSRKSPCTPNRLEMRADSLASTQEVCELSRSTQEEASLSNRYVGVTLSLLHQVQVTPR